MALFPLDIDPKELSAGQRDNLVSLLSRASRTVESEVLAEFKERGLAHIKKTHLRILLSLDLEGNRISVLTERSGLSKQTVSSHTRALAKRRMVRLEPDPSDGRAKLVVLTREGLKDLLNILEIIREVTTRYAKSTGQRRMTQLHSTLKIIFE